MTQAYDRIIATITTASDASQVVKAMVNSTEWRAGTSGDWNATDCTLTASNVYQFRTPLSGMISGFTAILPKIKASVVVDWDATATAITSVGNYFMYYYAYSCASLTSLSVPDTSGLTSVGNYFMAYYARSCTSLTSLSVPDTSGLKTVGTNFMYYYAYSCASLTSLSVPDTSGLTSVGTNFMANYARSCTSLTSLSVPDTSGLKTVGTNFMYYYANGCVLLTSLLLPSTTGWFTSNDVSWSVPSTRLGSLKGYAPNSTAQTAWQALTVSGKTLYINYIQSEDDVEVTSGPSQNLTLTCAAGSYSLTGTSVTLTHTPASQNLTLACNAGSYSLTGTNADLTVKRNYVLACSAGSYSLTGTNAALTSARTLICESASGGTYPDIIVSGAGTTAANGTYNYGGMFQEMPYYVYSDYLIFRYTFEESELCEWTIAHGDFGDYSPLYSSGEVSYIGVDTPDLVTTWQRVGAGSLPVPTVTAAPSLGYVLTGSDVTLTYTQGAQNLTLTCESGSYSLTGTNADFEVKRNYVLNLAYPDIIVSGAGYAYVNGNYNYTGIQNGRPSYTHTFESSWLYWLNDAWYLGDGDYKSLEDVATPDLVSIWYTFGEEPSLITVTAANAYKLSGSDCTLTVQRNYTLVCESGSYTLTGTDITFGNSKAYSLTCEAGAYTLTGSSVSFVIQRNYSLACETGSYTLTGSDVTLTYTQGAQNFTLACEAGSYALTGTNAGLTVQRNYTLECASGSYSLTGSDVTLDPTFHYSLTLESGSYTLTGTDATLTKTTGAQSYTLACSAGSYSLTGTNAGLTSARTMALESGSYALTGTNADFYRALVMACEAGTYALTGTDATFNANYVFALGMGSYVLAGTSVGLFILSPTPACRTATIEYENRTFAIPHENRTATIEYENRTFAIPHENRTATIEFENRTLEVKCH